VCLLAHVCFSQTPQVTCIAGCPRLTRSSALACSWSYIWPLASSTSTWERQAVWAGRSGAQSCPAFCFDWQQQSPKATGCHLASPIPATSQELLLPGLLLFLSSAGHGRFRPPARQLPAARLSAAGCAPPVSPRWPAPPHPGPPAHPGQATLEFAKAPMHTPGKAGQACCQHGTR